MASNPDNDILPVIFMMGPTASGKTALALELYKRLPVEIISVDSAMVYRGLDIGTAKPSMELRSAVPHHLIDICDPVDAYSAGQFMVDAAQAIQNIYAQGKIPLLAGGTGLYFRALEQGFSILPNADPGVRTMLEHQARQYGWETLHKRLAEIDPPSAARIHPNDPQRIQRALEVYEITGKTLTALHQCGRFPGLDLQICKFIVAPRERIQHHELIRSRFLQMLEAGLVEEVRGFYRDPALSPALPSMRLVGYRQIWQYLDGDMTYNDMINKGIMATRQLAKRQMTWLRGEAGARWLDSQSARIVDEILKFLGKNPLISQRL